jgi:hypothetical protein
VAPVTCGAVRTYLASLANNRPAGSPTTEQWESLARHGAVTGTAAAPVITDVGRQVLAELEVRASRTDPLPLETVAEQLDRIGADLDDVAKSASYFLAELGPVVPTEAVPLLRIVALGLANRRETPEEIAEEFRNAWGSVEVMSGDPRDRLMAAELINSATAPIEQLYAPMMQTMERVRSKGGHRASSVTVATVLHLAAGPDKEPALDAFFALRAGAGGDEAAALLAATGRTPDDALRARDTWISNLPALDPADAQLTAAYLTAEPSPRSDVATRIHALVPLLAPKFARPGVAAALLAMSAPIEPAELVNWLGKAGMLTRSRKLAPTEAEFDALALALVHGLPAAEFVATAADAAQYEPSAASLVALHAWLYRPLVAEASRSAAPPAR